MMRKLVIILVPLCVLYFLAGGVLMWMSIISKDAYLSGGAIVGGLASVLALLSFIRPTFSRTDLQNMEAQSLLTLADVSAEVKRLEAERSKQASAINDLERQKQEMELLVRKASMTLFLREQYEHRQNRILEHLNSHPEVAADLSEMAAVKKKLTTLEEQIDSDENVELLKSVISSSTRRPSPLDTLIESVRSPTLKMLLRGLKAYIRILSHP